ncbi:hypothetical protein [Phenylobacterium sp.]|uniref:hypothetical protein n=1 Tax=Phenylobacterium sp. TaxID=1871053 RepID=UPI002F402297
MSDVVRLILLLLLAGAVLTFAGAGAIRFMAEERRIRRALKYVLGAAPEALVSARGRGVGFSFSRGTLATAWDCGAWCLVYRIDELMGAELVVDGEVLGRAYRGEPRRALDRAAPDAGRITLRLLFDDAAHPDFELDLWIEGAEARKDSPAYPAGALQEANRWLARAEAILRRQGSPARPVPPPTAKPPAAAEAPAQPERRNLPQDDGEDELDDDEAPF